ncbi:MBL fold metallo-hydrolase [Alkalicoccus luteus]|uniref:MBL fold metallo-hydrolase n=1 Tax=Alkalicoccus luteus TaxID=1237094 RepID=A0A969TVB7_9BACI|nr:MBL fold metallo-hydrolase [Alkalicoccus luteus]NJP37836.1 MBL fold metallo-hydrolase [Alkalicoccus luteus]
MQELKKLSDRFYYLTPVEETDRPILGAVVGDNLTLLIDAGNSEAHVRLFLDELTRSGVPAPSLAVLTHWHWDHVFGASALNRTPVISTEATKTELKRLSSYTWDDEALDLRVDSGEEILFCAEAIKKEFQMERSIRIHMPEITFNDELVLDLGGITCRLVHAGGDHAPDHLIVHLEEEDILFAGDITAPNLYASSWHYTSEGTKQLVEKLKPFSSSQNIISHWKPLSKEMFTEELELLEKTALLSSQAENEADLKQLLMNEYGKPLFEEEELAAHYFMNGKQL